MRFSDLFNPERGPEALVRLAFCSLVVLVAGVGVLALLNQLGLAGFLLALLFLTLVSPLAYLIREARQGRPRRQGTRRGAERTPLLPPNEVNE
jgi:hypothetical protein